MSCVSGVPLQKKPAAFPAVALPAVSPPAATCPTCPLPNLTLLPSRFTLEQGGQSNHVQTNLVHLARFAPPNLGRGARMTVSSKFCKADYLGCKAEQPHGYMPARLAAL